MLQKTHHTTQNNTHSLKLVLLAENIRTPANVGMMMRLSEAFGVEKIYFIGDRTVDLSTKVKRASRNTYKTVKYEFVKDGLNTLQQLISSGYQSVALEITNRSQPLQKSATEDLNRIVLVVGSERQGISEELLQLCKYHYHIPMFGDNSSINVVNALSIGLFKLTERF